MTSNFNQIQKWCKLKKYIVIDGKTEEIEGFIGTNFKFYKFYSFLSQKPLFFMRSEEIRLIFNKNMSFCVILIKFYYNLKFDCFSIIKTEESLVLTDETRIFSKFTKLKFPLNLMEIGVKR